MESARQHEGRTIELEISIDAAPDQVFEAWADPEVIARWFVDQAEGRPEAGRAVYWSFEAFGLRHPVPVVEVVPGRKLVFGGELMGRPSFLQEFECEPQGSGTRFRLRNSGFGEGEKWDDEFAAVESGWVLALATLKVWLERYQEGERVHRLQMRPAVFEFEQTAEHYHRAEGLAKWFGERCEVDGERVEVGTRIRADLADELVLDGVVLETTPREVLIDWPQLRGVLALKCFTMSAGQRAVCLDVNGWPVPEIQRRRVDRWMTIALNVLVNLLAGEGPARFTSSRRTRHKFL